jgi:hypothetical protein
MAGTRIIGSAGARSPLGGEPVKRGTIVGKGEGTRAVAMPRVKRIYSRCEAKTKAGQPCKAPNVKGQPLCQGHINQKKAQGQWT